MYSRSIFLFALLLVVTDKLNGFEVSVKTNPTVVEFGHSLEVTCSTTCNNPSITLEYKPGINPNRTKGDKWITDRFLSVQKWDFTAPCTVRCSSARGEMKEDKQVIPVYNRNLSIVPLPDVLEVNKRYQLECIGPKVYPNNQLILTWLRGSEVVVRNSTEEPGFPEDGPLKNIFHFTPSISDNGLVYTCLAELKLDANSTKWITNTSVTLQMYYKPQNTVISVNNKITSESVIFIRKGDGAVVTCRSNGIPAVTIKWRYPHQGSKNETYPSGVLRISEMTSEHGGTYTCIATNLLGSESKTVIIGIRGVKDKEWIIMLIIIEVAFVLCVVLAVICCWMLCYLSKSGSYVIQENPSELN